MNKANLSFQRWAFAIFGGFYALFFSSAAALAADNVEKVTENIALSTQDLPGILTAASYLIALLLGVTGILKIKDHVLNPTQTPLRTGLIRLLIGGSLLALPIVYEAMQATWDDGSPAIFDPASAGNMKSQITKMSGTFGGHAYLGNFNHILKNISNSIDDTPGIIIALTYLLGLLLGVAGLLKLKDHVENPEQVPLKEGVIRLLIGGALFAIPTVYDALFVSVVNGGLTPNLTVMGSIGMWASPYAKGVCLPFVLPSLGNAVCNAATFSNAFPLFLSGLAYLIGLGLGVWGVLKIKAHVLNPSQVHLSEGLTRLLAAGLFFALPAVVAVMINTIGNPGLAGISFVSNTLFNDASASGVCDGLDGMVACFMDDMLAPANVAINFFSFSAGVVLIMVGISRLIKSTQEGARGPMGFGTFMTFIAGGALCSYDQLMRAATATFFFNPVTLSYAELKYTKGLTGPEVDHAHVVISAALKFMIIVGLVSFVRGIFIIRGASEGHQQDSVMAGVTHMVGGALAVNLGPLLNAVQTTLGLTGYGIGFS